MATFEFEKLDLDGAYLISSFYSGDKRGGFTKSFEADIYNAAGIPFVLNETFSSRSMKNVLRGLHFQTNHPQAKLVSVLAGAVWDVIVDLRPQSATFKQWRAYELNPDNHVSIYVPRGFAHGFVSLEDDTIFQYLIDNDYAPELEGGILWNGELNAKGDKIDWQKIFDEYNIDNPLLSEKDQVRISLVKSKKYFKY